MSNTERQRKFREANPGYYARLNARRRAAAAETQTPQLAAMAAAPSPVRMLPAPREQDLLLQQIAPTKLVTVREKVAA